MRKNIIEQVFSSSNFLYYFSRQIPLTDDDATNSSRKPGLISIQPWSIFVLNRMKTLQLHLYWRSKQKFYCVFIFIHSILERDVFEWLIKKVAIITWYIIVLSHHNCWGGHFIRFTIKRYSIYRKRVRRALLITKNKFVFFCFCFLNDTTHLFNIWLFL